MKRRIKSNLPKLMMKYYGVQTVDDLPSINTMAAEFGIATNTIASWLRSTPGRIDLDTVLAFCVKLDCTVGDLLSIE